MASSSSSAPHVWRTPTPSPAPPQSPPRFPVSLPQPLPPPHRTDSHVTARVAQTVGGAVLDRTVSSSSSSLAASSLPLGANSACMPLCDRPMFRLEAMRRAVFVFGMITLEDCRNALGLLRRHGGPISGAFRVAKHTHPSAGEEIGGRDGNGMRMANQDAFGAGGEVVVAVLFVNEASVSAAQRLDNTADVFQRRLVIEPAARFQESLDHLCSGYAYTPHTSGGSGYEGCAYHEGKGSACGYAAGTHTLHAQQQQQQQQHHGGGEGRGGGMSQHQQLWRLLFSPVMDVSIDWSAANNAAARGEALLLTPPPRLPLAPFVDAMDGFRRRHGSPSRPNASSHPFDGHTPRGSGCQTDTTSQLPLPSRYSVGTASERDRRPDAAWRSFGYADVHSMMPQTNAAAARSSSPANVGAPLPHSTALPTGVGPRGSGVGVGQTLDSLGRSNTLQQQYYSSKYKRAHPAWRWVPLRWLPRCLGLVRDDTWGPFPHPSHGMPPTLSSSSSNKHNGHSYSNLPPIDPSNPGGEGARDASDGIDVWGNKDHSPTQVDHPSGRRRVESTTGLASLSSPSSRVGREMGSHWPASDRPQRTHREEVYIPRLPAFVGYAMAALPFTASWWTRLDGNASAGGDDVVFGEVHPLGEYGVGTERRTMQERSLYTSPSVGGQFAQTLPSTNHTKRVPLRESSEGRFGLNGGRKRGREETQLPFEDPWRGLGDGFTSLQGDALHTTFLTPINDAQQSRNSSGLVASHSLASMGKGTWNETANGLDTPIARRSFQEGALRGGESNEEVRKYLFQNIQLRPATSRKGRNGGVDSIPNEEQRSILQKFRQAVGI